MIIFPLLYNDLIIYTEHTLERKRERERVRGNEIIIICYDNNS